MAEQNYLTVKIFCWIIGVLVTIFALGMTSVSSSAAEKTANNNKEIKLNSDKIESNNKLIYEHQLIIVDSLGDIKSSISELKK